MTSAEELRNNMQGVDVSQYSPAVMQNKALMMLASEDIDSLYDVEKDQIPYIAYLRAIDSKLPIPGTIAFISAQLSLSRSRDRKGRIEFGQAINKQSVVPPMPMMMPGMMPVQQQPEKPGIFTRLFSRKRDDVQS